MAAITGHSITHMGPCGKMIKKKSFVLEKTNMMEHKLYITDHWMVTYKSWYFLCGSEIQDGHSLT